ncbi:alpha/beta hydrolase [Bacteroidia bacterium]|nr:alpha/beta hydrolase [Bacteroidia bacterium]MDA9110927.1 alpha/beta hydrolase [Bacteroidia bacterium]MDA9110941.1 alpha/beta hydrolase [Bacteroidia bacterium]MDB4174278.1 alpha/beta hydrolase [Bacteroidia bacterium]
MEHHIGYSQRAKYYREGSGKKLLYVLHGYGQLAKFFIRKFHLAVSLDYTIIAPEGQHYFYLNGTSGRVGASWMTKENREQDIQNYLAYLDAIHAELQQENDWEEIVILGFSQGVATAFRWLAHNNIKPSTFLICSGLVPPDVDLNIKKVVFDPIQMTYFSGVNDPYRTEASVQEFYDAVAQSQLDMELVNFDGVHEVYVDGVMERL